MSSYVALGLEFRMALSMEMSSMPPIGIGWDIILEPLVAQAFNFSVMLEPEGRVVPIVNWSTSETWDFSVDASVLSVDAPVLIPHPRAEAPKPIELP